MWPGIASLEIDEYEKDSVWSIWNSDNQLIGVGVMLENSEEEKQGVALECLTIVGDALSALGK